MSSSILFSVIMGCIVAGWLLALFIFGGKEKRFAVFCCLVLISVTTFIAYHAFHRLYSTLSDTMYQSYDNNDFWGSHFAAHKRMKLAELAYSSESPTQAHALHDMGFVSDAVGHFDQSVDYYTRAISLFEKNFGPQHSMVAQSLDNLGRAYASANDYRNATDKSEQALKIYQSIYPPSHIDVLIALENSARHNAGMGNCERALQLAQTAKKSMPADAAIDASIRLAIDAAMSTALLCMKKFQEAEPFARAALKVAKNSPRSHAALLGYYYEQVALALEGEGKFDEAEKTLREGITFLDSILGDSKGWLVNDLGMALTRFLTNRLADNSPIKPLLKQLVDDNFYVRLNATQSLGAKRLPEAVLPLALTLNDDYAEVRCAAAYALGQLGKDAKTAVPFLMRALNSSNSDCGNSAWALGQIGMPEASVSVTSLIAKTSEQNRRLSYESAQALRALGTSEALEALKGYKVPDDSKSYYVNGYKKPKAFAWSYKSYLILVLIYLPFVLIGIELLASETYKLNSRRLALGFSLATFVNLGLAFYATPETVATSLFCLWGALSILIVGATATQRYAALFIFLFGCIGFISSAILSAYGLLNALQSLNY